MLSDTKDEDIISNNRLLENRHAFLSLCEKNHYQFDTLRRAKYSSIMILHHLRNATVLTAGNTCSICHKDAVVAQSWECEICPEFGVCAACYQEKGSSCHIHKLTRSSTTVSCRTESRDSPQKPLMVSYIFKYPYYPLCMLCVSISLLTTMIFISFHNNNITSDRD